MKLIKVQTKSQTYSYRLADDFASLSSLLAVELKNQQALPVIDENVFKLWRGQLSGLLHSCGLRTDCFIVLTGEKAKSFKVLQELLQKMLEAKLDRNSCLLAIGGGVTGDLAGFAASVYKRGINIIHVPTTLLSMVDSSVGGKTGINFSGYKNIIGTIKQPVLVAAQTEFLNTLPVQEFVSGLGEVMKYAFLGDEKNFNRIYKYFLTYNGTQGLPAEIITSCVKIKAGVVSQDENEAGLRKILNLGHTFAHAFESVSKYRIPHGQAVIFGLRAAIHASRMINLVSEEDSVKYLKLAESIKLPFRISGYDPETLINVMQQDKKGKAGKPLFVLIGGIGELLLDFPLDVDIIKKALAQTSKCN